MKHLMQKLHNKKVLVTGSSGFLGKHLVPQIENVCNYVHLYQDDIRNIGSFNQKYDIVCHLAALNKVDSQEQRALLFDVNVNGTLAVMDYCRRKGARSVFASSSAVYKPAIDSRLLHEDLCIEPVSLYGVSKMLAEGICKHYAKNFGVSVTALRIFNMYGQGQSRSFLIPYCLQQICKDEPIILRSPKVARDFIYCTDVARAFVLACGYEHKGFLALNVGTGRGTRIRDLVEKLALCIKFKLKIDQAETNNSQIDYVIADVQNISKVLNWNPKVSMLDGLVMVVQSWKEKVNVGLSE